MGRLMGGGAEMRTLIQTEINLDHCNKFCILKSGEQNETTSRAPLVRAATLRLKRTTRVNDFFNSEFN